MIWYIGQDIKADEGIRKAEKIAHFLVLKEYFILIHKSDDIPYNFYLTDMVLKGGQLKEREE